MSKQKKTPGGKKPAGGKKNGAKKPQYTGKELVFRRIYIGITILSAIIVAAYVFWHFFSAAPDPTPGGAEASRRPQTTSYINESGEVVEVEIPGLSADRKDQFYTFLLVGQSQETGGSLTDTMMMAAYDVPSQKLSVMSLPRDTYVSYGGRRMLLNAVYPSAGGDTDDKGIEALKSEVADLTGITPDYHVVVQWEAIAELVDAIGGVEFDVPRRMYYNDLSQHFKIDLQPGLQHIDGDKAMQLIRWRANSDDRGHILNSGYVEGDLGRIKTQQAFMKAVIKKCLQPEVVLSNLTGFIEIFQKNVVTNLGVGEMAYFAKSAVGGLDMDNVSFQTLPWYDAGDGHLFPSGSKIVDMVNEGFNPYKEDIQLRELDLVSGTTSSPRTSSTPEPSESDGGEEPTDEPSETPTDAPPEESQAGEDDPLLPPGVTQTPRPSRRPETSDRPEESQGAEESQEPSGEPSAEPSNEVTEPPVASREPENSPEPPPATPPSEDEPLLPPGV